jgi:hypothetical protein
MGQRDFEHNQTAAANLVASIASEIDRNTGLYDLSRLAAVDGIKLPEINKIAPTAGTPRYVSHRERRRGGDDAAGGDLHLTT